MAAWLFSSALRGLSAGHRAQAAVPLAKLSAILVGIVGTLFGTPVFY